MGLATDPMLVVATRLFMKSVKELRGLTDQ